MLSVTHSRNFRRKYLQPSAILIPWSSIAGPVTSSSFFMNYTLDNLLSAVNAQKVQTKRNSCAVSISFHWFLHLIRDFSLPQILVDCAILIMHHFDNLACKCHKDRACLQLYGLLIWCKNYHLGQTWTISRVKNFETW